MDKANTIGTARTIEVVQTTLTLRGNGKDDPFRRITEYWSRDGALLAEHDPHAETEHKQRNEYIEVLKESEQLATTEKRRTKEFFEESQKEARLLKEEINQIRVNRRVRLSEGFGEIPPGTYILKRVGRKKR